MKKICHFGCALFLLLALTSSVHSDVASSVKPIPKKKVGEMSGHELVQALVNDKTRDQAFRELARRHDDAIPIAARVSPEVVVCPQGPNRSSLYLVLS